MEHKEIFSLSRMERCVRIQTAIMENWVRSTSALPYTVRATDSVAGIALSELRLRYFAVGAGEDLVEIPFHDLLVVFTLIERTVAVMKQIPTNVTEATVDFKFSTVFPDHVALRLLSKMRIETPFDPEPYLAVPAA